MSDNDTTLTIYDKQHHPSIPFRYSLVEFTCPKCKKQHVIYAKSGRNEGSFMSCIIIRRATTEPGLARISPSITFTTLCGYVTPDPWTCRFQYGDIEKLKRGSK